MVKKRIILNVCDVCLDESRITDAYRVAEPKGRLKTIDLCDEHALPVRRLFHPKARPVTEIRRRLTPDPSAE